MVQLLILLSLNRITYLLPRYPFIGATEIINHDKDDCSRSKDSRVILELENLNSFYIQQRVRWGEALTQGCWYVLLLVVVLIVFHNILSICVYLILSVYFIMWCATYLSYIYISAGNRRTTTMYLISPLIHVL